MNRRVLHLIGAVVVVGGWLGWSLPPADAIETDVLAIEPVDPDPVSGRLSLVAAARADASGTPVLGGPVTVADCVRLERDTLTLGPGAAQIVGVTLRAGSAPSSEASAAVLASPAFAFGDAPAVLARVGLVLTVRQADAAGGASVSTGPAVPGWLTGSALALAAAAVVFAVRAFTRRWRAPSFLTPNPGL